LSLVDYFLKFELFSLHVSLLSFKLLLIVEWLALLFFAQMKIQLVLMTSLLSMEFIAQPKLIQISQLEILFPVVYFKLIQLF